MAIGILLIDLRMSWCRSLKEKRSAIRPLLHVLHEKHNISVSEISHLDQHRFSRVGIVECSNSRVHIEQDFHKVLLTIRNNFPDIDILAHSTEFLN